MEPVASNLWRRQLPPHVKQSVAGLRLGAGQMDATLRIADAVFSAMAPPPVPAAPVAAIAAPQPQPHVQSQYDLDTSADEPALQVAAFRGRGGNWQPRGPPRGGYRGRGQPNRAHNQYRSQQQSAQPAQPRPAQAAQTPLTHIAQPPPNTGPRHPDNPPHNACHMHWKYGRSAQFCRSSLTCPWKHIIAPQPNKNQ